MLRQALLAKKATSGWGGETGKAEGAGEGFLERGLELNPESWVRLGEAEGGTGVWNSPVARVGHGEQEEISRAREQERTNPHLHGKDLGAVRQNDSLPRWGDRFLLPAGKEWGEGGPGNWDCGVTLKNMRKTPGDGGARPGSGGRAETWAIFVSEALSSSLEFWEGHVYQAGWI